MPALVTEDCPPRCPLSGSHRWPRASTSVEGPATMRVTQDLSGPAAERRTADGSGSGRRQFDGPPRSWRAGSCTVGCPFVRPTPCTTSAIATARTTCGRQRRAIDASHARAAAVLVESRPPSPITTDQIHGCSIWPRSLPDDCRFGWSRQELTKTYNRAIGTGFITL